MIDSPIGFRWFPWVIAGGVALVHVSCAPSYKAPPVTPELVKAASAPASELQRGFELYQLKCAKCHAFENPADYTPDELRHKVMPEMARKSKLGAADEKAVLAYLLAARSAPAQ